jgi:hypothetical protein
VQTAGYFRFDTSEECAVLAEGYRWLCPHYNYWIPSFRLAAKEKQVDGHCRKACEKELRPPYERLMEVPDVSSERETRLKRQKTVYNPVEANRKLNGAVEKLLTLNRKKGYTENNPGQEEGQAAVA